MSKISNIQQKRSSKGTSKPLQVAIAFPMKGKQDSPEKRNHVSEGMIKVPVGNKFVPPKHSSTPKPKQNSIIKPVPSSNILDKHPSEFQTRNCFVLLERLKEEDLPIKASIEKAKVNSIEKKSKGQLKKKEEATVEIPPPENISCAKNSSARNGKKGKPTNENENNFVTTIPSEALKSFGLLSCQSEPHTTRSSPLSDRSLLIETPPRTSTACSSVGDHSASHTESCDGTVANDPECPTTVSRSLEASAPILFPSNNIENVDLNASSSSQDDPLEMGPQDRSPKTNWLPVDVHCDYLYGLNQRMNCKPDIINLQDLDFSNPDVRLVAVSNNVPKIETQI